MLIIIAFVAGFVAGAYWPVIRDWAKAKLEARAAK